MADAKGEPGVLIALASGRSAADAAHAGGVSERTVYRRLEDHGYRRAVTEQRTRMLSRAAGLATAASLEAVLRLQLLARDATSESVKLGAAKALLDAGTRLHDTVDLAERLEALEERIAELDRHRPRGVA